MTDTDWIAIGAIAAAITALFTAAMAVAIVVTAIYAKRTLVATREDSRSRTRPVLWPTSNGSCYPPAPSCLW